MNLLQRLRWNIHWALKLPNSFYCGALVNFTKHKFRNTPLFWGTGPRSFFCNVELSFIGAYFWIKYYWSICPECFSLRPPIRIAFFILVHRLFFNLSEAVHYKGLFSLLPCTFLVPSLFLIFSSFHFYLNCNFSSSSYFGYLWFLL